MSRFPVRLGRAIKVLMPRGRLAIVLAVFAASTTCVPLAAQPLPSAGDFIRRYQGNFGSIEVSGCGFHNDNLFDPVALLVTWTNNRPCFEKAMAAHASRGDNRVVVDPRADYHGGQGGGIVDLWHEPARFREFLVDIRRHSNDRGERFEVLLFLAGDSHIRSFLKNGAHGVPDPEAEAHALRDIRALAAVAADQVAGTAVCWECRPQADFMTAGTYERLGKAVAEAFPRAWHGQHLTAGADSWSSRPGEGDDPNGGNKLRAWQRCTADGWCDGLLYQFGVGAEYLQPLSHPNYTGHPGALGRYFEVVVRLANDPEAAAARAGAGAPQWASVDLLAFEFIYDAYNNRSDEAYGLQWCRQALAIGGWGCGSASYRRSRGQEKTY
ncbi:MAG: hypothetical protein IT176_02905 [Acidobacteria bacterium]|nr:hypothetical protein [Acidobacteriota bacterium]